MGSLTGLTALKLQHCQGIRRSADLAPLSLLTGLSSLSMSGCSQTEGSGISSLAPLTMLKYAYCLSDNAPETFVHLMSSPACLLSLSPSTVFKLASLSFSLLVGTHQHAVA